jgi:putative ABC transport system permease protein
METLFQDLRYGFRKSLKSPGFSAVAVLTLGLGIGANTAIFSVLNAVLLRPLPYPDPRQLVRILRITDHPNLTFSAPDFLDFRDQNQSFLGMAAFYWKEFALTGGEPERALAFHVSPNLFTLLGVEPALGRSFLPEEGEPGKNRVVVLSHGLWQRRFGGDSSLVGKSLALNGESYTVIGVMRPEFVLPIGFWRQIRPQYEDLWVPLVFDADEQGQRGGYYFQVIARLKPGMTLKGGQAELDTIAGRLGRQYPDTNTGMRLRVVPLQEEEARSLRPALLVLLGAVGFVLLIACANVANLLLARAGVQHREMAIRAALGASRLRLARQLLIQSLELALLGGLLGTLLSLWGTDVLLALAPKGHPQLQQVGFDGHVFGFALLISVMTGLAFGLAPALKISKPDLNESLKQAGKGSTGSLTHSRLRALLVVAEVALSLLLLTGAGLLIKSFWLILSVDPGYRTENVLAMEIEPPPSKYLEPLRRVSFFEQVLERVEALPGVRSASVASALPLRGGQAVTFSIEGRASVVDLEPEIRTISPHYFQTMGIPLLRGRPFTRLDDGRSPPRWRSSTNSWSVASFRMRTQWGSALS